MTTQDRRRDGRTLVGDGYPHMVGAQTCNTRRASVASVTVDRPATPNRTDVIATMRPMTDEANDLLRVTATDAGFTLAGEIDGQSSPLLAAALGDVADRHIAVDMSAIDFVDSSGLRVLIDAHQRAEEAGGSLTLVEISSPVARLLELSGMNGYLRIKPTTPEG